MSFEYLYNLFDNMVKLGSILWKWLNSSLNIGGAAIPIYAILLASGLTVGLGVRLIRSFMGN